MNDLIKFLTSTEIMVVYAVIAVACLLCFIIYLLDKNYYKRKQKQNTRELNKLVESIKEEIKIEDNIEQKELYQEPILEPIKPELVVVNTKNIEIEKPIIEPINIESIEDVKKSVEEQPIDYQQENNKSALETFIEEISPVKEQDELKYTNIEPNQIEAQEELQRLTEALEQAEEETKNIDLTKFEEEQEQNAIISIDELMSKTKTLYENDELEQFDDEGDEPISLMDLERRMNPQPEEITEVAEIVEPEKIVEPIIEPVQEKMILDEFNNIKIEEPKEIKKFQSSPVISPVYGIEKKVVSNELELENTANYDKLDEEIKKTNEFLTTLRELQKNLD